MKLLELAHGRNALSLKATRFDGNDASACFTGTANMPACKFRQFAIYSCLSK